MKLHLREWRLQRLLTQRALAKRAGLGFATICRLERGQHTATLTTLGKLAKALDIKPEQLVEWDEGE